MKNNDIEIRWYSEFVHSKYKLGIVFPDSLNNAISNLAVHTLYRILSAEFYTDIFSKDKLTGLRTGLKIQDFDFLFFSIDYEPNYLDAIQILLKSGIEPLREKRNRPILIGGGAAISSNPFPLLPFFDLLCIGEAEAILPQIISDLESFSPENFKERPWAVTDEKRTARRVFLSDLNYSNSFIAFYSPTATFKMNLVEVSRSCPNKCRFCLLSYNHLPPRWLPIRRYEEMIKEFPEGTDIGLVGGSVLDHPEIEGILDLSKKFKTINPSSIKINTNSVQMLEKLRKSGLNSVTIAPETGSETLRKVINKDIKNEEILEFIKILNEIKFKNLKLYLMIGLPFETIYDIIETNDFLRKTRELFKGSIEVTFSIFVPKPHTPFQYFPLLSKKEFNEKMNKIKIPPGIKAHFGNYRGATKQLLFSRAGEELGNAIYENITNKKPLETLIDIESILYDEETAKRMPFNLIDSGVNIDFLKGEINKSKSGKTTPRCVPSKCNLCGICNQGPNNSRKV